MSINEYKKNYSGLKKSEVRRLAKEDADFRVDTENLYRLAFRERLNKNCTECWVDAYALLMIADPDKFDDSPRLFDLRAGALLIDIKGGDNSKMCTRVNLTDDLALFHLKANPKNIEKFSKYPDNWEELVDTYGKKQDTDPVEDTASETGIAVEGETEEITVEEDAPEEQDSVEEPIEEVAVEGEIEQRKPQSKSGKKKTSDAE